MSRKPEHGGSSNDIDQMMIPGVRRPPGRPRRPDALNDATRARNYRERLRESGVRQIAVHLPECLIRFLDTLAVEHGRSRSQVVADLLRGAVYDAGRRIDGRVDAQSDEGASQRG